MRVLAVRRVTRAVLFLAVTGGVGSGTAEGTPTRWPSANMSPLVVGWQQFFQVQWSVATAQRQRVVEGYITNTWGFAAADVRLLVNGYDAAGRKLGQLVAWGPMEIDPGSRAYFDVSVPPAASYEVAILSWNWIQTGGPARGLGHR